MRKLFLTSLSLAVALTLGACKPIPNDHTYKSPRGKDAASIELAQELVSTSSKGEMKADSLFDGPDGLHGIIVSRVSQPDAKQVVWASENMEVLLPSIAFDRSGTILNDKALEEHGGGNVQPISGGQESYISASELGDELVGEGFIVGKKGPLITAFMDPNCGYCNQLYKSVKPEIDAGNLRVRFIMVGFLQPSSTTRSATILSARNPGRALAEDEEKFGSGGISGAAPSAEMEQKVQANTELMGRAGRVATPAIFSCPEGSETPTYSTGAPQDIKGFIDGLNKNPSHPACK